MRAIGRLRRELSSAGLLAPGAGYASPKGSQPVRDVQRLLRRLGDAPGPIDGLYGPLTAGAVQRFQEAHALAVDGVVGPQTMGPAGGRTQQAAQGEARTQVAGPEQPGRERYRAAPRPQPPATPSRTAPSRTRRPDRRLARRGRGGLALALLLVVVVEARPSPPGAPAGPATPGPRLGLVCAALLAAYVVGAATGAVFASHATPDRGAKPSTATAEPRPR